MSATPSDDIEQALEKFFNAEKERSRLIQELDLGVMDAVENLIKCVKHAYGRQKLLEQNLQETRRKYQAALDELRELQAAKTKLEQDKIKIEQKLQWTKVELQVTKDELKRVEEKTALEAELDHWEDEISRCRRRIGRSSNSHEVYESQLKVAQEARDRCLERFAFFIRLINSTLALSANLGYGNLFGTEKNFLERHLNARLGNVFLESGYKVLSLWCAIEQALLAPPIREYIAGRHLKEGIGQEVYSHGKNIVTYIKRIPITVDDLLPNIEQKNF